MGPALNMASSSNAYLLSDRGTWLSFKNRGDLEIVVEGDAKLFNQYGVILVNPEKHPNVKKDDGSRAIGTILDPKGKVIASIQKNEAFYGEVDILGKPYITGYEPIRDQSKGVIGIYYVGYLK